jgi:hypothetical protein
VPLGLALPIILDRTVGGEADGEPRRVALVEHEERVDAEGFPYASGELDEDVSSELADAL